MSRVPHAAGCFHLSQHDDGGCRCRCRCRCGRSLIWAESSPHPLPLRPARSVSSSSRQILRHGGEQHPADPAWALRWPNGGFSWSTSCTSSTSSTTRNVGNKWHPGASAWIQVLTCPRRSTPQCWFKRPRSQEMTCGLQPHRCCPSNVRLHRKFFLV